MTCVEMPLRELGRRAAELVLDLPWDAPIRETLQTELTISDGTTVAPPPPATRGRRSDAGLSVCGGRPDGTAVNRLHSAPDRGVYMGHDAGEVRMSTGSLTR